jgi:4-amino-4-deoxy-L-arabinose transferase-like glycosyltransferase
MPPPADGNGRKILWFILAGALALRLAAVPAVHAVRYTSDENEYLHMARQLLEEGVFRDSNGDRSVRAPLYPFFLAALLWITGNSVLMAHVAGCLLGTAAVGCVYALALKITGGRTAALFAAGITAGAPGLVIYSALLQTEMLYIVFFLLAFLCLYRLRNEPDFWVAAALGLCSGLAALTRPVFLGFVPTALVLMVWPLRKQWHSVAGPAAVMLIVAALTIAPWTARNWSVLHAFVPVASGGGSSLLTGNNPYATGTFAVAEGFDRWYVAQAQGHGIADPASLNEVGRSGLSAAIALTYMSHNPAAAAVLAAKKSYIFWIYPVTHSDSYVPVQALAVGFDALLLCAAVIGVAGSGAWRGRRAPLCAAVIFFWLVQALLHAEARFRLPLVPLIAIVAGWGVSLMLERGEFRRLLAAPSSRRVIIGGLALIVVAYGMTGYLFLTGAF